MPPTVESRHRRGTQPFLASSLGRAGSEWRAACNGPGGREAMRETESSLQQFGEFLLKRQLEGRETNLSERRPLVRQ
jgi:hypothetical protein